MPQTLDKETLCRRFDNLKAEHQKFVPAWKDLKLINPFRGIFNNDRSSVGKMINHKELLSAHGTHALRIFASGLNSGMTSKSSRWFKLTIKDKVLMDSPGVREWLDDTQDVMYDVLNQSNIYETFYNAYEELGQFGTACYLILDDFDEVIRGRSMTCGEYFLAVDNKGRPNRFGREFEMTVEQLVREFGLESVSMQVKQMFENKQYQINIKVCHMIEPNDLRDLSKIDNKNMAFRSIYWEQGKKEEKYLRVSGHKSFRVVAPRWDTVTTDAVYGYGPGWQALGSVRELQATRLDKMMMQAKLHNPPTQQDANVQGNANLLPGGSTKVSSNAPNAGVRPAYEVPDALQSFIELLNEEKEEIDKFFFVNLFLMLASMDKRQMTAEEVATRQQEKIMMMGPALHRLDNEMLSPTLEMAYEIVEEAGLVPELPDALVGVDINIEFTGILAQAQKSIAIQKIDSVLVRAGQIASMGRTDAFDIVDIDEAQREAAQMDGAPARIILDKDVVAKVRAERQRQQQQAIALEAASSAADTTQKLAGAKMGEGNALDNTLAAVGGQ